MLKFFNYFFPFLIFFAFFEFRFLFDFFSYQRFLKLAFFDLFTVYHFLFPVYLYLLFRTKFRFDKYYFLLLIFLLPLLTTVYEPVAYSKYYIVLSFYIIPFFYALYFTRLSAFFKSFFINTFIFLFNFFISFGLLLNDFNFDFLGRLVFPYVDPLNIEVLTSANWLAFLLAVLILLSSEYVKSSYFKYINILIASVFLIMTQSYGALLALSVVLFVRYFKKMNKKKLLASFVLMCLFVGPYVLRTPKFKVLMGDYHMPNSIDRRIQLYNVSYNLFLNNVFLPLGMSNYQNVFKLSQAKFLKDSLIPEKELPPHPHNLGLFLLIEFGIVGVFLFIFIYSLPLFTRVGLSYYYMLIHFLIDLPFFTLEHSFLFFVILLSALTNLKK